MHYIARRAPINEGEGSSGLRTQKKMLDTHRVEFARLVWIQSPKLVRDEPRDPRIASERMGGFVGIREEVSFDITNMFTGQWELVCAYNSVNPVLNVLAYISHGDWRSTDRW